MTENENKVKWYSLMAIWFGGMACVPSLLLGSILVSSMTFNSALIASTIGFSFVVLYMSYESIIAVKFRKSTVEIAKRSFGKKGGNIIVGLIIGVATLGWFAVQSNIAGSSFSQIMKDSTGIEIATWLSSTFWGSIMVLTAVFGFKYLKWLNYIAVPAILILVIYGLIYSFTGKSWSDIQDYIPTGDSSLSIIQAIGIAIGFVSVGGVISPDYNRYAETKKDAVLGSVLGVLPTCILFVGFGAIFSILKNTYDIVTIFSTMGFPIMALSVLILVTWTTNVINVFSAGLALNNLFGLSEKHISKVTLVAGIIGVILASIGVMNSFMDFLNLLTVTVPPVAGVIIADFFIVKKDSTSNNEKERNFNPIGIASWFAGVLVMIIMDSPIKNFLGIIVSLAIYSIVSFVLKKKLETNKA